MQSFTNGTEEMVLAMVGKLPAKYEMTLNREDMESLVRFLSISIGYAGIDDLAEEDLERVQSLFGDIATTLDIEGV